MCASSNAGGVRRVPLASKVATALERACADFEDPSCHDSVSRVQAQVDDVRGVMQGNIDSLLANADQLSNLQSKTDAIAGASKGFYREARGNRRQAQWQEYKLKFMIFGGGAALLFIVFGGTIFGRTNAEA